MSRQEPTLRDYRGKRGTYPTTRYHWRVRDNGEQYLVLCPACSCRPCPPQCVEQFLRDEHGLWDPQAAAERLVLAGSRSQREPSLVQRANAAAAEQRAEERQKREEAEGGA